MLDVDTILSTIDEIRSAELIDLQTIHLNYLKRSIWIEAIEDLDNIHKNIETESITPFIGYTYLISYDNTLPYIHIHYLVERINNPLRWKAIITFSTMENNCPVKYTDIWESKNNIEHFTKQSLCYTCNLSSTRYCHECGIYICDNCSPNTNICHYCIIEYNEF